MKIHGFYYSASEKGMTKLEAPKHVLDFVEQEIEPKLKEIDPKDYWNSYAVGMIMAAPQGYLAYKGTSLWIYSTGIIKAVEFTHHKIRACTVVLEDDEGEDFDDGPAYDIVYTPHDWMLEDGCEGELCSEEEIKQIDENVDWTNELHRKLHQETPLEETEG